VTHRCARSDHRGQGPRSGCRAQVWLPQCQGCLLSIRTRISRERSRRRAISQNVPEFPPGGRKDSVTPPLAPSRTVGSHENQPCGRNWGPQKRHRKIKALVPKGHDLADQRQETTAPNSTVQGNKPPTKRSRVVRRRATKTHSRATEWQKNQARGGRRREEGLFRDDMFSDQAPRNPSRL
jgi:hypothetical protein